LGKTVFANGRNRVPALRVVLVDDNPAILETLVEMLHPDFTIAGTFSTGASFLAAVEGLNPDIILLDISLGDMTGFYVAKRLKNIASAAKLVFLSVHENPDFVRAAFDLGALGYVFKSQINPDLIDALAAVSRGTPFTSLRSP
jgi:DNA-binding NarL/FixJ family response regulator